MKSFCQSQLVLHLFRPELLISFGITSITKVKNIYQILGLLSQQFLRNIPPAGLTQPARLTGFPKICYPAPLIWTTRLVETCKYLDIQNVKVFLKYISK